MPEGHTLHRLARLHQRRFAGAPVAVSSPQGRFAPSAAVVDGRILRRTSVWGKHLFHHYADGPIVHVHLGLYGTFTEWARPSDGMAPEAVGQVRMRMIGTDYGTDLRGPTVCEVLDEAQVGDVVARLGPDPLRSDADPSWAWARIAKSRRPIGALLMDQTVMAGVGNVYRSELLFRHRIDPFPARPGDRRNRIRHGVDRFGGADEGGLARRQDRRGAPRTRSRSAVIFARPAPHVRVPARRRAVPGVWDNDQHHRAGGPKCVLVSSLSNMRLVTCQIGCDPADFVIRVQLNSV